MYIYFRYQCIHWYKFDNDEVEHILFCTCAVLCNILKYIYTGQIAKRCTCPVFVFNTQIMAKHSTWSRVFGCVFRLFRVLPLSRTDNTRITKSRQELPPPVPGEGLLCKSRQYGSDELIFIIFVLRSKVNHQRSDLCKVLRRTWNRMNILYSIRKGDISIFVSFLP